MSDSPLRLAVFDCDGTLVDSQAEICAAMAAAFASVGVAAPPPERIRRVVGLSLVGAIAELAPSLTPDEQHCAVAGYREAFQARRLSGNLQEALFDGIPECLAALERAGWLLGVATGKSDRGLAHVLDHHGLTRSFVTLQTADRHPSKPHPAMLEAAMAAVGVQAGDTVMIGDTSFDIAMAHAAGVRAVGVAWGYHEADELLAAGADAVACHPAELIAILENA